MPTQDLEEQSTPALVLGAGSASRFGGAKLLAPLEGRPVLGHALATLGRLVEEGMLSGVHVVIPSGDRDLETLVRAAGGHPIGNPRPDRGLAASLRIGLDAVDRWPAALVCLGDQPRLSEATVRRVLEVASREPDRVIRPRYGSGRGEPGHPVCIPARFWPLLRGDEGDRGFGPLLGHQAPILEVPVPGRNPDIDTPADLRALAQPEDNA